MIISHRHLCAEAQVRGVQGGGSSPGKSIDFLAKTYFRTGDLDRAGAVVLTGLNLGGGNMASLRRRGALDMRKLVPRPRREFSTWLGRRGTAREQQDVFGQGSPSHHRAQGSSVNPFGYPPLSDM